MNGAPGYQSLLGFTTGTASYPGLTASKPLLLNASRIVTSGDVDLKTQTTGTLPVTRGGTGSITALTGNRIMISSAAQSILEGSALTNGQLFIGSTGVAPVAATVAAGSTSLVVTPGAGTLSIDTAQGITTAATPTFAAATLTRAKPRLDILSNIAGFGSTSSATLALQGSTAWQPFTIVHDSGGGVTLDNGSGGRLDLALGGASWFGIDPTGLVEMVNLQLNQTLRMLSLTPGMPVVTDASSYLTTSAIDLPTQTAGVLAVANGGTNSNAALADGALMVSAGGAIVEGTSSSAPAFSTASLTNATNQLLFGTPGPNMTTLNVPNPVASQTIRFPDCGTANADLVVTESAQTINGIKTFGNAPILSALTASLPLKLTAGKVMTAAAVSLASGGGEVTGTLSVANGGTGLASTTANQLLYSSATNAIAGLATANSGVLITSGAGVPSISTTIPATTQANITTLGTITTVTTLGNTTDASSTTVGGTVVSGGLAVAKKAYFGDVVVSTTAGVRQGSYAFRSEVTTAQTITPSTDTVLTFTTAGNSSGVTYATGAFTVDKAGMYAVAADCNWFGGSGTTTTTSEFIIWATVNNVASSRKGYLSTSIAHFISLSTILDLAANDVVRFVVAQTSAGNIVFGLGGGGAGTAYAHASVVLLNVR